MSGVISTSSKNVVSIAQFRRIVAARLESAPRRENQIRRLSLNRHQTLFFRLIQPRYGSQSVRWYTDAGIVENLWAGPFSTIFPAYMT